jgi:hypothetical protein
MFEEHIKTAVYEDYLGRRHTTHLYDLESDVYFSQQMRECLL